MPHGLLTYILALCALLGPLSGGSAHAQRLKFTACSSGEQARIRSRLRWIRSNQSILIQQITARQPDAFLGQSQARLKAFFRTGVTKVSCSRDPLICGSTASIYEINELKTPFPHRYPLTLCMEYLQENDPLTIALAHQVGHHILINTDKTECTSRCTDPNLAILFSETTQSMLSGQPFSMEWCLTACAPPRDVQPLIATPSDAGLQPVTVPPKTTDQAPEKPLKPSPNKDL